jgi:hypothetical protein
MARVRQIGCGQGIRRTPFIAEGIRWHGSPGGRPKRQMRELCPQGLRLYGVRSLHACVVGLRCGAGGSGSRQAGVDGGAEAGVVEGAAGGAVDRIRHLGHDGARRTAGIHEGVYLPVELVDCTPTCQLNHQANKVVNYYSSNTRSNH